MDLSFHNNKHEKLHALNKIMGYQTYTFIQKENGQPYMDIC